MKNPTNIRGRKENGTREALRIRYIVKSINNPNSILGNKFRQDWNTGKPEEDHIRSATDKNCGGRGKSFDFILILNSGEARTVEEKGTDNSDAKLSESKPWKNSVQAVNIPLATIRCFKRYAKLWFDFVKYLAGEYKIDISSLTLEEYMKRDFFHTGSVRSGEMQLIKKEYCKRHAKPSGKAPSIQEQYSREVKILNTKFVESIAKEDKKELIDFIQGKLDKKFGQKDAWLQTTGLVLDVEKYETSGDIDFEKSEETCKFKWFDKIPSPKIDNIEFKADISNDKRKSAQLRIIYSIKEQDGSIIITEDTIRLRNRFSNCSTSFS